MRQIVDRAAKPIPVNFGEEDEGARLQNYNLQKHIPQIKYGNMMPISSTTCGVSSPCSSAYAAEMREQIIYSMEERC
jgi:hypothetical protein